MERRQLVTVGAVATSACQPRAPHRLALVEAARFVKPVFGLAIYHEDGTHLTGPNTRMGGLTIPEVEGDGEVRYTIEHLSLLPGRYVVSVSAYDHHLVEPLDHRERVATFTVTLSNPSGLPISVHYATEDGTGTVADNDYEAASGTLTFAPGATTQTISVTVNGDTTDEADETFDVNLTTPSPSSSTITTASATGASRNVTRPSTRPMSRRPQPLATRPATSTTVP